MDSPSDQRTANNVARHEYRVLTDREKADMKEIKDLGLAFIEKVRSVPGSPSRETAIAITKAEEAVMWAVKHVTR